LSTGNHGAYIARFSYMCGGSPTSGMIGCWTAPVGRTPKDHRRRASDAERTMVRTIRRRRLFVTTAFDLDRKDEDLRGRGPASGAERGIRGTARSSSLQVPAMSIVVVPRAVRRPDVVVCAVERDHSPLRHPFRVVGRPRARHVRERVRHGGPGSLIDAHITIGLVVPQSTSRSLPFAHNPQQSSPAPCSAALLKYGL
jgi:hypothetical protein